MVIPVACVVAAVYGLGAMRRPLMFLLPLIAVWIATPHVDHPTHDVIKVSAAGCFIGWMIGDSAGWMSRHLTGESQAEPLVDSSGPQASPSRWTWIRLVQWLNYCWREQLGQDDAGMWNGVIQ